MSRLSLLDTVTRLIQALEKVCLMCLNWKDALPAILPARTARRSIMEKQSLALNLPVTSSPNRLAYIQIGENDQEKNLRQMFSDLAEYFPDREITITRHDIIVSPKK